MDIVEIMGKKGADINSSATTSEGRIKTPLEMLRDRGISIL